MRVRFLARNLRFTCASAITNPTGVEVLQWLCACCRVGATNGAVIF